MNAHARRWVNVVAVAFLALSLAARAHAGGGGIALVPFALIGLAAIDCFNYAFGSPSVLAVAGQTLGQLWPLQSDAGNNPTLTPGGTTSFKFLDVPDRATTGPLANYMPGVVLTLTGNVVQPGGGGTAAVFSDQFFSALFSSLDWIQSFYGTVLRGTHVKGIDWQVIEWAASGYKYLGMQRGLIAAAGAGTYPFEVQVFVPANSVRHKQLFKSTMNLALLYRASQLKINVAPASAIAALSPGATLTNFKASASASLIPRQRILLGTPVEPVLSEPTVNASTVTIPSFGTDTGFQGVDAGGGVAFLAELAAVLLQGGGITPANMTSFTFPWRGQALTFDILGLLAQWKSQLPQRFTDNLNNVNSTITGTAILQGPPYIVNNPTQVGAAGGVVNAELVNLLFWPLVLYSEEALDLTDLQTANSDQSYTMNGTGSGTREILGLYARSWQTGFVKQWVAQVMASGLYSYVYPGAPSVHASRVRPYGERHITTDQLRYLPYELKPTSVGGDIEAPGVV